MRFIKELFETSSTETQESLTKRWQTVYSSILTECVEKKQAPSIALVDLNYRIQTLVGQGQPSSSSSSSSSANTPPDYHVLREYLRGVKSELQKLQLTQSAQALQQFENALPNTTVSLPMRTVPVHSPVPPTSTRASQGMSLLALPMDILCHGILTHLNRRDAFSLFKSCRFFRTSKDLWLAIKDKPSDVLIATGDEHTLIYDIAKNMLYSCGKNRFSQLGLGHKINQNTLQLVKPPEGKHIQHIAAGGNHTIIQCTDGTLYSCGQNAHGQLGLGHTTHQNTLQSVTLPKGKLIQHVAAGVNHTIILCTDGSMYSCGANDSGQLGLGHNIAQNTLQPVSLPTGKHVQHIAAGGLHTIILCTDGSMYSCGANDSGQLGLGGHHNQQNTLQLVPLPKGKCVQHAAAGAWHTIILCTDGTLHSCGANTFGQLGLGHNIGRQYTLQPVVLPEDKRVQHIAAGNSHTVILCGDGTLHACGNNFQGQLGLGHTTRQNTLQPVPLPKGGERVQHIAAGKSYTVAQCADNLVYSCGDGSHGQLGLGHTTQQNTLEPVTLPGDQPMPPPGDQPMTLPPEAKNDTCSLM